MTADSLPNDLESLRALAAQVIAERDAAFAEREAAIKERDAKRAEKAKRATERRGFHLDPVPRRARTVWRALAFRHDAVEAKLAGLA